MLSDIWQWMRSSLAQDQNNQKKKKTRRGEKKKDRRRKRSLLSSTRRQGNANFFFCFFSPSRVESQNTRTTAFKKLTRRQGEQWLWKLKKKEWAKKELAPQRPLQQRRARKTLRPPDLCRKQTGEVVIMWSITMCRSEKFQYDFDMSVRKGPNSDFGFCMLKSHYRVTSWAQIGIF